MEMVKVGKGERVCVCCRRVKKVGGLKEQKGQPND